MARKSNKETVIGVPVTLKERERFQKLAQASYLNLAAFIRKTLNELADVADRQRA